MNAVAHTKTEQAPERIRVRAEHVSLEVSGDDLEAKKRPHRKTRLKYTLSSKLRGCTTELALLEEHFLAVRAVRPDSEPKKYDFDLRFAHTKPVIVRHVAWFWIGLALLLTVLAVGALWLLWPRSMAGWIAPAPLTAIAALLAAAGSVLMFLRRTTESLEFVSEHGGVTLVSVTGAIGSARDGKKFFIELIKSIGAAKTARAQPPHQFLRDEMREHHRLRELGALSEAQYQESKSRILSAH